MSNVAVMKSQLSAMSTRVALKCVCQKGAGNKCFFWGGQMWTARKALEEWEECFLNMPCSQFGVINFFGGPPCQGKWHQGTILSMICDLIMFEELTKDLTESEKLSL